MTSPQHDIHAERILILDFGAQYTQLIGRRVREAGVYSEIHPWDMSVDDIERFGAKGIILSGGPESVNTQEPPSVASVVFELGVPVLGICYGMQAMAAQLGGAVTAAEHREFGYAEVTTRSSILLSGLADASGEDGANVLKVWMSHGDRVDSLPAGFNASASTRNAPFAAMEDTSRHFYAVQFHPEVVHTPDGARLLSNFTRLICGLDGDWTMAAFREEMIEKIRAQVGSGRGKKGQKGGGGNAPRAQRTKKKSTPQK